MSFMTVGVGRDGLLDSDTDEVSCFESFDPATNSAVYRAAERPGTSSMPNARDPVPLRTSTHGGSSSAEGGKAFKFDGLFGPGATQSEVYDAAASNIVRGVLEGYNGAILAYGQTGSGKTHSMRGPSDDAACWPSEEAGVIPRALAQLLEERERLRNDSARRRPQQDIGGGGAGGMVIGEEEEEEHAAAAASGAIGLGSNKIRGQQRRAQQARQPEVEISLTVSYLQIYCEMLHDLLDPSNSDLSVRENSDGAVYVQGLSRVPVTSLNQCLELLREGDQNRTVSATKLNATSSRSHAACIIHLERRETFPQTDSAVSASSSGGLSGGSESLSGLGEGGPLQEAAKEAAVLVSSTLTMVDLAGSERIKRSGVRYQQLEETKAINLSLSALGNCVSALATERPHVPFRDSKLTRLLSQSLGGNARTALLVTLAPGNDATGENLNTLQFAQRASRVKLTAVRNQV